MAYYPEIPYKGNQVIIASDRVHLLAKNDSVLIFGKQSVAISSINTINLDATSEIILQSPKVKLGSLKAESPVILGDVQTNKFISFLDSVATICVQLQSVSAGKEPPTPELGIAMLKLATFGKQLASYCNDLKNQLPTALSKTSFTV
jgi:hypothetical protein